MYCRTDPPHPKRNSNNLYPLHRVVLENKLGRMLTANEIAHHKDRNKYNNTSENLEVKTWSSHSKHHGLERFPPQTLKCSVCGKDFALSYRKANYRKNPKKTGIYCSRSCASKGSYKIGKKVSKRIHRGTYLIQSISKECPICKATFFISQKRLNDILRLRQRRNSTDIDFYCSISCSSLNRNRQSGRWFEPSRCYQAP